MTVIKTNKAATHNYEILESFDAGIVLTGAETKSIKNKHIQLKGSYVRIRPDNTVWLISAYVSPYKPAGSNQKTDPERPRKLLLTGREINRLRGMLAQKGLTITPLKVYTKGGLIKVSIALVRGLKTYDKRAKLKKHDIDRDTKRLLKERFR